MTEMLMTGNSGNTSKQRLLLFGALSLFSTHNTALAKESTPHEVDFSTRARYADLQSGNETGEAASILFRVGATSRWNESLSSYLEVDSVLTALENHHSDGVRFNGKPVIPDSEGTEINQAWLTLSHNQTQAKVGRQAITHDHQRFIGTNSFWQNDQTFDALNIRHEFLNASHASYTYITNVNRIFGDDADERLHPTDINYSAFSGARPAALLGDHEHHTHLARTEFKEWDHIQWVTYGYFIDNHDAKPVTNNTIGTRLTLNYQHDVLKYKMELEAASQKRPEIEGKPSYDYHNLNLTAGYQSFDITLKHERLSADGQNSFTTPLASLHDFHGWADKFSNAPRTGLADTSLKLKYRHSPWKFDMRYHRFSATENSTQYGGEIDVDIMLKINKRHSILLRYADFRTHSDSALTLEDEKRIFINYAYQH